MSVSLEIPDLTSGEIYGIKTFDGGSAKMQRLPLIPEIFNCGSKEEFLELIQEPNIKENLLEYTNGLRSAEGNYSNTADAIVSLIENAQKLLVKLRSTGLNKKERDSVYFGLSFVFAAMFKTAGNATMFWGGWSRDPAVNSIEVAGATDINLSRGEFGVQIPTKTFNQLSQTNVLIYNILNSLLNQAADEVGNPALVSDIRQRAIEITANGLSGVNIGMGQGKESIKIDYKLNKFGRAAVVDINAGNMGIPDGADLLGNALKDALNLERQQVTDSVIEAVMATFNSQQLRLPNKVSILTLDSAMTDNNIDVDLNGYIESIKLFAARRGFVIDVDVVTQDQVVIGTDADLLFRYTGRTKFTPDIDARLRSEGRMLLPEPYTNLIADKVSAQLVETLVGDQLPSGIFMPKEVQSERETEFYQEQGQKLVEEAFRVAAEEGWNGVVIKTATKFRKAEGRDFVTALIYPLTELGFEVACSEIVPLVRKLSQIDEARCLKFSFNQLFDEGIEDKNGITRQVELRVITTLEA